MPRLTSRAAILTLALAVSASALPQTASADASGLCRSLTMIAFAPTDIVFGPFIAAKDIKYGLDEMGDSTLMRIAIGVPGYMWLNALQFSGGILRMISGGMEFVPGVFTLFREEPSRPLFTSQDESWALYSADFGPCPIRIGTSYQTINEN